MKSNNYINNKDMLQHIIEYRKNGNMESFEYLGNAFLLISKNLAHKNCFRGYTFIDEMISEGASQCLTYFHNFDPEKSNNPFAYFTQIIYNTFLRFIATEKKYLYTKYKVIESQTNMLSEFSNTQYNDNNEYAVNNSFTEDYIHNMRTFIHEYEESMSKKDKKKKKKIKSNSQPNLGDILS